MKEEFKVSPALHASRGKRFANYIIDYILFNTIFFILGVLITIVGPLLGTQTEELFYQIENINPFLEIFITYIFFTLFYFIMESGMKGRTIGKYITNTKVVNEKGEMPDVGTVLKRSLCRLIPFEAFSYLGEDARGWHDSISKTYVVDTPEFERRKKNFHELEQIGIPHE